MPVFRGNREHRTIVGRYSVDKEGVVYSDGSPLTPVGGTWVNLYGERRLVSYLVARAWIPNPEGREYVVHKNGDLRDNRAENLEWSETKETGRRRGRKPMMRAIGKYDWAGNLVERYYTVPDAALATGLSQACIRAALKRKGKSGGFFWVWI